MKRIKRNPTKRLLVLGCCRWQGLAFLVCPVGYTLPQPNLRKKDLSGGQGQNVCRALLVISNSVTPKNFLGIVRLFLPPDALRCAFFECPLGYTASYAIAMLKTKRPPKSPKLNG